ncbi:hypothetical protein E2P81_ATG11562 [Venturia nashicola]|uniref:Uncharacterized protein n=1 Tax=Venturia nashicola TaxID=86259 RepID=A0A4Z1PHF4_9PEZI|nr:hypothetical protein E6O75_ATG11254 [Venturia nashicola]TLD35443.1 hypothetical protein E2P81_ATG11562 [Venturia nashicola]
MPSSFAYGAQTLPRNFTFTYHDGTLPKTPEPTGGEDHTRFSPPPPPPREYRDNFRLRRRRPALSAAQRSFRAIYPPSEIADASKESSDIVISSIEVFDAPIGFDHAETSFNVPLGQLAVLSPQFQPYSPPKTPAAQIYGSVYPLEREDPAEDSSSQGESLTRPSTACSGFSDSSISSSVESFPSLGYNNSPKTDLLSLFGEAPEHDMDPMVSSPLQSYGQAVVQKQSWTQDMDDHLWITYMRYLQDPTHTPFKMLPGTAPPLGVCSRVVREAKRTWKGLRTASIPPAFRFARWGSNRAGALNEGAEGSTTTPVANDNRRKFATWPRSDAATRKRLRDLCKRKPTLSAHYNRLMHARSPSPFLSSVRERSTSLAREVYSPPPAPVQAHVQGIAFSTRDMNVSLFTSISTTMQPGHPLSQLTSDAATPRARASTQFVPAYGRSPGHQKAQSVHLGFGINDSTRQAGVLASPFRPTHSFHSTAAEAHGPLQAVVSGNNSGLSLDSPVELHQPQPLRSIFKRPATQELEDVEHSEDPLTRQNHLMKELFGPSQPIDVGHRRVRSRGFSLGDMGGTSRLSGMFSPPAGFDQPESSSQQDQVPPRSLMPPPPIDRVVRLGSPFVEKPHFNTFPRNFSLSGLEPAMEIHEDQAELAGSPPP